MDTEIPPRQLTLQEIFTAAGGVPRFASVLGIDRTTPHGWQNGANGGKIPQRHVVATARLIGVHPERIRPDLSSLIADWNAEVARLGAA